MSAAKFLSRILPAAVAVALLGVPASASARQGSKHVTATIALGDKRPAKARKHHRRRHHHHHHVKASAAADCANTDLLPTADNLSLIGDAVLCLHNQVRAEKGLPLLKENSRLERAALGHSDDMVDEGYFDHTAPGGDTFVDRILSAHYAKRSDGWTLGENLAWGTGDLSTPAGVMDSWMHSAGHRANILKRAYREVGIGIELGVPGDGTVGATYTLDFGVRL